MNIIHLLADPVSYEFMTRALIAAVMVSIVCALLSCWLVLIGWSLMGDAVSHAVLPGVVLAYVLDVPFAIGALAFGFLAVILIGTVRDTSRVKEDAAIGIVFTTLFALGIVLVSVTPSDTDLTHIIFGNILGVSRQDLTQILILTLAVLLVVLVKRRDFTLYAFDPTHAHAIGMSPRLIGAVMLALLAVTAVATLQIVGVVLVVAMLIIPGASAYLLTNRMSMMLILAPAISVGCSLIGLYTSYYADTASGGMIVLAQGFVFTLIYLFSPRQGVIARQLKRRRLRSAL
ncbi:metal ABC transporter permease [Brevibacterium luteolum]|uniref:Metal ABC transporter permease n=1 Tax=Brevibacterium luteolum TaxID=199591 RepID=A0A6G8KWS1_9MICO|nr:metal ABC transporter permease [Brevibacterium luteolum]QIN29073.1 metal ABC transporter permease [Brevibacterium luteolum]